MFINLNIFVAQPCTIASNEKDDEEFYEWLDESLVDANGIATEAESFVMPTVAINDIVTCPWEEDLDVIVDDQ